MGTRWGTRWESYNDSQAGNWDSMRTRWGTSWENKICPMPRCESKNGTDNILPSRRMGHSFITGKCMRHASIDLDGHIWGLDWWCSLHWLHWSLHSRCTGLIVHCCANGMCWLCQIMRLLQVQQKQTAENCINVLHTPLWTWHVWPMFDICQAHFGVHNCLVLFLACEYAPAGILPQDKMNRCNNARHGLCTLVGGYCPSVKDAWWTYPLVWAYYSKFKSYHGL